MDVGGCLLVGLLVIGLNLKRAARQGHSQTSGVERNRATGDGEVAGDLRKTRETLASGVDLVEFADQRLGNVVKSIQKALQDVVAGGGEATKTAASGRQ